MSLHLLDLLIELLEKSLIIIYHENTQTIQNMLPNLLHSQHDRCVLKTRAEPRECV